MKNAFLFLIFLITIPSVFGEWYYNSESVLVNFDISSESKIFPKSSNGYVETATVNLTFFPRSTGDQQLLDFYTSPKAELVDGALLFKWQEPEQRINFRVSSNVKKSSSIVKVREKIRFPIENPEEELVPYTKPSATIDSDSEDIIKSASKIAEGEDDLYSVVFKIADWVNGNINYSLSTLTADVSQKASWVLQNKYGVCDELTSLFIAFLRAVGIPARFVSGISYTNSELFPEKWGPHGWAEVYFPNYGWVPFDVTYGEFGWVDPTHIKFKDSIDSDEPSTYYKWTGRNVEFGTEKLNIKTELVRYEGDFRVPLHMQAFMLKKGVSPESFNLLELDIENPNDFYYSTQIYLSKPNEINISYGNSGSVLLMPGEKKRLFWILNVDKSLNRKYSYKFPLVISTLDNISAQASFVSSIRENPVSFEEINGAMRLLLEEKENVYSANISLDCLTDKNDYYEYENVTIKCNAKNLGNVFIENAAACFENKCQNVNLGISRSKSFSFDVNTSKIGNRETYVALRSSLASNTNYVNFRINDIPKVQINGLDFPENVSYEQNFTVFFTIDKKSMSNPKNVLIKFSQGELEKSWYVDELTESRKYALRFIGSQLGYGKNDFKISVDFYDGLRKAYKSEKEFSIDISNVNFIQAIPLLLNKFNEIDIGILIVTLLTGTIVFIVTIILLFRRERKRIKLAKK